MAADIIRGGVGMAQVLGTQAGQTRGRALRIAKAAVRDHPSRKRT